MPRANQQVITSFQKMLKAVMDAKYSYELPNLDEEKKKYVSFRHYIDALQNYDEKHNGK